MGCMHDGPTYTIHMHISYCTIYVGLTHARPNYTYTLTRLQ